MNQNKKLKWLVLFTYYDFSSIYLIGEKFIGEIRRTFTKLSTDEIFYPMNRSTNNFEQKQPSRRVLRKRWSNNTSGQLLLFEVLLKLAKIDAFTENITIARHYISINMTRLSNYNINFFSCFCCFCFAVVFGFAEEPIFWFLSCNTCLANHYLVKRCLNHYSVSHCAKYQNFT